MRCEAATISGGHLVRVYGEIDMSESRELAETLVQFANGDVTVDLSNVPFCDSSGLNALVAVHRHLQRHRAVLRVRGVRPGIWRVMHLAGLDECLDIEEAEPVFRADGQQGPSAA